MKLFTLINLFSFCIALTSLKSQINEQFYYKDHFKNLSDLDSLLRSENESLEDTYFVITFPVYDAVSSAGMQLYKAYHSVNKKNVKIVLLVLNEDGVRNKDLDSLLKRLLKITEEEYKKITVITNRDVYKYALKGKELVRLLYVYRNNVYYDENQKLHSFYQAVPGEKIEIKQLRNLKLNIGDSCWIKKVDSLFAYKENSLLLLGDITNILYEIDLSTGDVLPAFDLKKYLTPHDVYYSEIADWDTAKYHFARKYNSEPVKN